LSRDCHKLVKKLSPCWLKMDSTSCNQGEPAAVRPQRARASDQGNGDTAAKGIAGNLKLVVRITVEVSGKAEPWLEPINLVVGVGSERKSRTRER
jgi:hypothetical protein